MKTKLLLVLALAGSSLFAGPRVVVGFGVRVPVRAYYGYGYYAPPPPVPYIYPVVPPYYGYSTGYYVRPPYRGAFWVAPRYYGGRYYRGYWRR